MPHPEETDRRVVRFVVDTLVVPEQVELVRRVLARALCGADDDHAGPCRVAWDIRHLDEEHLDEPQAAAVRAALGALEVVPGPAATAALLEELDGPHRPTRPGGAAPADRSAARPAPAQGLLREDAVGPSVQRREPAVVPEAPAQRDG